MQRKEERIWARRNVPRLNEKRARNEEKKEFKHMLEMSSKIKSRS
jgi:hypothetical protein